MRKLKEITENINKLITLAELYDNLVVELHPNQATYYLRFFDFYNLNLRNLRNNSPLDEFRGQLLLIFQRVNTGTGAPSTNSGSYYFTSSNVRNPVAMPTKVNYVSIAREMRSTRPALAASKSRLKFNNASETSDQFIMDRCGLPCIPSLKGKEKVQSISLQHNLIVRIDSLSQFRCLVVLNLYDNKIEKITGLDNLTSLRVLMLGKNRLKRIEGLDSLINLDILDLHGNQLVLLSNLSHLKGLRVLNLAANSIKKLAGINGLISLEELNLKRNRVPRITTDICDCKKIQRLYLSNNDIKQLNDLHVLSKLSNLKELTLDGNPVTLSANYVLFTVGCLNNLRSLDQNEISSHFRHEAALWYTRHAHGDLQKIKPLIKVTKKPFAETAKTEDSGKKTAVVRPMTVGEDLRASSAITSTDASGAKPKAKFRHVAFSAMVCTSKTAPRAEKPVFQFCVRPPTAELGADAPTEPSPGSDFDDTFSSWSSSDSSDSEPVRKTTRQPPFLTQKSQKLATGCSVTCEQLRDLRILSNDKEVTINGVNIIRMLHQMPDSEAQKIIHIVFTKVVYENLVPHFASLRKTFPNTVQFTFREAQFDNFGQINALALLEGETHKKWVTKLDIKAKETFLKYAVYRYRHCGLEVLNSIMVTPDLIAAAEQEFVHLDKLVLSLTPQDVITQEFEKYDSDEDDEVSEDCSDCSATRVRNAETSEVRTLIARSLLVKGPKVNRSKLMTSLEETTGSGLQMAVNLSLFDKYWDQVLEATLEKISFEVQDESQYRKKRMTDLKSQLEQNEIWQRRDHFHMPFTK